MEDRPRIAFWGTPELTRAYLDALEAAGLSPVVVVTNPDRPKGRGQELAAPPAKLWALERSIPVLQPEKLDDAFMEDLRRFRPDISAVVAYGSIIPEAAISLPPRGTLNVHYSLLPAYRGASPTESAILAGDTETGCSIQVMVPALDAGPVIAEERLSIGPDETTPELRARLTALGARMLADTIPKHIAGETAPVPQDDSLATRARKIRKEDALLDIENGDPARNYRAYRAYAEWPRVYFFARKNGTDTRVIITKAHFENGSFAIDRVLPEGRKEIAYEDFKKNG